MDKLSAVLGNRTAESFARKILEMLYDVKAKILLIFADSQSRTFSRLTKLDLSKPRDLKKDKTSVESHSTEE